MNEVIESLVKPWLKRVTKINNADQASLNAFMTINSKTRAHKETDGSACYGSIGSYWYDGQDVLINWVATGNAMENWKCSHGDGKFTFNRQELITYFSYLARKSPYAKAFLSKHCGNMVDKQYAIMDPSLPGNLVVGAMTAHRQAWEYTRSVKMFLLLRQRQPHINPDWHFILAQMLEPFTRKGREVKFSVMPLSTGHTPFNASTFSLGEARNFIAHKLTGLRKLSLIEGRSYAGVNDLFSAPGLPLYKEIEKKLIPPDDVVDIENTAFAWNLTFSGMKQKDLELYSLQANLPVFESLYNEYFGGNK